MSSDLYVPPGADISRPSSARIYDLFLGGSTHFPADVRAAERLRGAVPEIQDTAYSGRGFHQRAIKWIARQGIRQFLDIGAGLPTMGNTHEIVRQIHPDARVVYTDIDPVVTQHSAKLLAGETATAMLCADLRDPDAILGSPEVKTLIDPAEPAGLLLTCVLMFVSDTSDPWKLVSRYLRAMAPGSYLAISHLTCDYKPPLAAARFRGVFEKSAEHLYFRTESEVSRFFDGLEFVPPYPGAPPGVTFTGLWGAEDPLLADSDGSRWLYCGVARIP